MLLAGRRREVHRTAESGADAGMKARAQGQQGQLDPPTSQEVRIIRHKFRGWACDPAANHGDAILLRQATLACRLQSHSPLLREDSKRLLTHSAVSLYTC